MNIFYWGEADMTSYEQDPSREPEQAAPIVDRERPTLELQLVSETAAERRVDEELFVSQWMAERQCSGV